MNTQDLQVKKEKLEQLLESLRFDKEWYGAKVGKQVVEWAGNYDPNLANLQETLLTIEAVELYKRTIEKTLQEAKGFEREQELADLTKYSETAI